MVDPVFQQELQGTFSDSLVSLPESGGAEYDAAALMTGTSKRLMRYHWFNECVI
jgi:hypothetical protein